MIINKHIAVVLALLGIAVVSMLFMFNESRKEVYFLCGNFSTATTIESIERQLATANLSYVLSPSQNTKIFTSEWSYRLFQCHIHLNHDNTVKRIQYLPS